MKEATPSPCIPGSLHATLLGTSVVALLALSTVAGCSDVSAPFVRASDDASGDESNSPDEGEAEGTGEGGITSGNNEAPPTWLEESLGLYYRETGFPIGIPAMYLGSFANLELRRDTLLVTHLWCDGDQQTEEYPLSLEDGVVHVRPQPEQTHIMWLGGPVAKELVIRPGSSCAELELEFIEPIHPEGSFAAPWTWRRGAVYISDECGDADSVWGADLSPDVPTECDEPG